MSGSHTPDKAEANAPWLAQSIRASQDRILRRVRRHSSDLLAGLTGGIVAVPDGMAASVIAGVPPAQGLYAAAFGPLVGGLFSRSALLIVTTTGASSLATFETLRSVDEDQRVAGVALVALLVGLIQLVAVGLGLARLTSFVSHSVMTGFLMGVGALIVLGQLPTLAGYDATGSGSIAKVTDLLRHVADIDATALVLGVSTILLILAGRRLGFGAVGPVAGLAAPSALAAVLGLDVETVSNVGVIPSGFPTPAAPDLSLLSVPVLTGALAVAGIVFVQTAGVAQSLPHASSAGVAGRDLAAAALANAGSSVFRGIPVAGSLGQSSINVEAGARTRWAAVLSGIVVIATIMLIPGLVGRVAMSSLAGLITVSAAGALDLGEAKTIWRTSWVSRAAVAATFILTLFLPIQFAVLAGVGLSALLYLTTSASDVRVVELTFEQGGSLRESDPPLRVESDSVTMLQIYGNLFFAGARTLARRLPRVEDTHHAVVVLRLRGKTRAGATAVKVLADYAESLNAQDGRLFLAGLTPELRQQMKRSEQLLLAGVKLFPATPVHGRSVARSYRAANTWLVRPRPDAGAVTR